jgi:DNA-binding LytR/AlgR family response regulator
MITAIAIDDEPLALDVIKAFCSRMDTITLGASFTETKEALDYLRQHPVDLLFLDIKMPAMSGIDFFKLIPPGTMVIFTTAYSEYAVEGFNLNAVDYLLKPFDFERFQQAVRKANEFYNYSKTKEAATNTDHFFIRVDYSLQKINFADIKYIEGLDNYLKIHLRSGKNLVIRMSMKLMNDKLPVADFMRVHRSFIIPLKDIQHIRNKVIYLNGGVEVPVGANYTEEVNARIKN